MVWRVEPDDLVEVEGHEDVEDAEAARAATEDGRGVDPAQVAVDEDPAIQVPDRASRPPCDPPPRPAPRGRRGGCRSRRRSPRGRAQGRLPASRGCRSRAPPRTRPRPSRRCRRPRGRRSPIRSASPGTAPRAAHCRPGAAASRRCARRCWRRRTAGTTVANAWSAVAAPMIRPPEPMIVRRRHAPGERGKPVLEQAARDAADRRQDDDRRRARRRTRR